MMAQNEHGVDSHGQKARVSESTVFSEKTAASTYNHAYGGTKVEEQAERKKHEDKPRNSMLELFGDDAYAIGYESKVYEDGTDNN